MRIPMSTELHASPLLVPSLEIENADSVERACIHRLNDYRQDVPTSYQPIAAGSLTTRGLFLTGRQNLCCFLCCLHQTYHLSVQQYRNRHQTTRNGHNHRRRLISLSPPLTDKLFRPRGSIQTGPSPRSLVFNPICHPHYDRLKEFVW